MLEDDAGDNDREDLSAGHDNGEGDWSEGDDGVKDEELTTGGADAEDDTVSEEPGVLRHELQ